jgi:hypothetical protein
MFARGAATFSDSDTDPMMEVSAHVYRSEPAEPQIAPLATGSEAVVDHHIEEILAAVDDLTRPDH